MDPQPDGSGKWRNSAWKRLLELVISILQKDRSSKKDIVLAFHTPYKKVYRIWNQLSFDV